MVDVSEMQLSELLELDREVKRKIEAQKSDAILYIVGLMKDIGISTDEVTAHFPQAGKRKGNRKARAPMYKNPSNENQTWCGFGIMPKWFKAHIESGLTKDDMLIV